MLVPLLELNDFIDYVLHLSSICEFEQLEELSKKYPKLFDKIVLESDIKNFSIEIHEDFLIHYPTGKEYIKDIYGNRKFEYFKVTKEKK